MLRFEKDKDGIGILTFDRPDKSTNILDDKFLLEFQKKLKEIFADAALKGLILTSAKKDFVAGADLGFLLGISSISDCVKFLKPLHESLRMMETQGKPIVCALNGTALGGGLELALACHYRVCLKDSKIQIGLPEVTLGLLPGGGGTQRLPRMIGIQPSLEFLTLGNKVDPESALKAGIVQELVETKEDLIASAKKWILKTPIAQQPWDDKKFKIPGGAVQSPGGYQVFAASNAMVSEKTFGNYPAPKAILSCVYEGLQVPFEAGLQIETRYFASLVVGPVAKNMIRTLFFGIQECSKGAERPKDVAASPVKKLGVLGAGMMGSGIAYSTAKAGIPVVLKDVSREAAEKGKGYSVKICDGLIEKGRLVSAQKEKLLELITATDDPQALKDCDLVIETVIEDRKIKAKVTQETENVCGPTLIMASNTSTLPITGLAEVSKRPDQFIGIHFFSPVDKMPLVEIILGKKTEKTAIAKSIDYVQQIKKTPIVVNDGRGFYTSRVFTTYIGEGISLLKEGVSPALIENAGKGSGMPVGPLAVADEVSIDLIYHILKQTADDLGREKIDGGVYEVAQLFVEKFKRLGRKSGGGFYEYPKDSKKLLWPELTKTFPLNKNQPSLEEVKTRLLTIQALESARCLEEGVLKSMRDGDVGSILGWGFPAYTGGTLSYIDMVGVKSFVETCEGFQQKLGSRFKPCQLLIDRVKSGKSLRS